MTFKKQKTVEEELDEINNLTVRDLFEKNKRRLNMTPRQALDFAKKQVGLA